MMTIGLALIHGHLGFRPDVNRGFQWLVRSAREATVEYPRGKYELAMLHENGLYPIVLKDHSFMIKLFQEGCDFGDSAAYFKLAEGYETASWGLSLSCETALHYYRKAANLGDIEVYSF